MRFFKKRRLQIESLEPRELLSVTPLTDSLFAEQGLYASNFHTEANAAAPTVSDQTATSIRLTWDASGMTGLRPEDPFKIEKLTQNADGTDKWVQVGSDIPYSYTIGKGIYTYEIKGLISSTNYTFRVSFGSTLTGRSYTDSVATSTLQSELKSEAVSSTSIKLSWNIAGKTGTYFTVQQRLAGSGGAWTEIGKVKADGSATGTKTLTASNLNASTEYEFQLEYYDTDNKTQSSQIATCETLYTLTTSNDTINSVNLSWDAGLGGTSHEIQICSGTASPTTATNWSTATTEQISGNEYKVTGLKENNSYYFRLRYNVIVDGETITRYTDVLNYSSPTSIKLENAADTSLKVSWTFTGKSGTAYYIQARVVGSGATWEDYSGANTTGKTYTLTGLDPGTNYEIRVRYTSSANVLSYSAPATLSTGVATVLDTVTANSATISWNIPDKKSGTNVSIERCDGSLDPTVDTNWRTIATNVAVTSYTNLHLGSNNKYYFRVTYTADTNDEERHTIHAAALTNGTLTASEASLDTVKLDWNFTPKQGTALTVQFFQGESEPTSNSAWGTAAVTLDSDKQGGTVTGLTPGRNYYFRVQYTSDLGTEQQTSTVTTITTIASNLIASSVTSDSVTLRWAVTGFSRTESNKNYVVYKRELSDITGTGDWVAVTSTLNSSQNSYTVSNLLADTAYEFKIGYNGETPEQAVSTTLDVNTKPATVSISNLTQTAAKLSWTFNTDKDLSNNAVQSGDGLGVFVIQKFTGSGEPTEADRTKNVGDSAWTTLGNTTDHSTKYYNLTGLLKSTTQYYRIVYTYRTGEPAAGAGTTWDVPLKTKFSEIVEVKTKSDIQTTYVGINTINVAWDAKTLNSGSKYKVQYRVAGTSVWTDTPETTSTSTNVTGLTADTEYEFQVLFNGSETTATLEAKTNPYILSVVSKELGITTASATVELKYIDGKETNFVLHYRLKGDENGVWSTASVVSTSNATATFELSLNPETEYEFKIVYDCNGTSHETEIKTVALTDDLMPSGVTGNSVKIQWEESSFPDKRPSSSYYVQWREVSSDPNAAWQSGTSTTSSSYTVTGLDANKEYEFRVQYYTVGDATAYSTIKKVRTKQPTITAATPQFGKVKIAWTFVSTDGFVVEYKDSDNVWRTAVTIASNTAKDITFADLNFSSSALDPETEYTFRVGYKTSQSGASYVYSDEIEITTLGIFKVADNSITSQGLTVKWSYVTDSIYTLQYKIAGTGSWLETVGDIVPGTKEYALTALSPGTTYTVRLTYFDGIEKYEEITVTTSKVAPETPTAVSAAEIKNDGATIKWTDNSEYEDDYILEVTNNLTGVVSKQSVGPGVGTGAMTHTLTGLDTKTSYTVKVYAKNTEGSSAIAQTTFTTLDITRPAAVTSGKATVTPKTITLSWKIKSVTDIPDPTSFRIEYYHEDKDAATAYWYEVNGLIPAYDSATETWSCEIADSFHYGEGTEVTIVPKTAYKFRVTALAPSATYGDAPATAITATTTALVAPSSLAAKDITLTSVTISFKDTDKVVNLTDKVYTLRYVEGKYTDWTKVPATATIQSVVVSSTDLSTAINGLKAATTYSYIIESSYVGETIATKPSNFTTSKLPTATTLKGGYTLSTDNKLAFQLSWKPPVGTTIPSDVTVSYEIEVSPTGTTGTFVSITTGAVATSPKGLAYTSVLFAEAISTINLTGRTAMSYRIKVVYTQGGNEIGSIYSATGRVTLPKIV